MGGGGFSSDISDNIQTYSTTEAVCGTYIGQKHNDLIWRIVLYSIFSIFFSSVFLSKLSFTNTLLHEMSMTLQIREVGSKIHIRAEQQNSSTFSRP